MDSSEDMVSLVSAMGRPTVGPATARTHLLQERQRRLRRLVTGLGAALDGGAHGLAGLERVAVGRPCRRARGAVMGGQGIDIGLDRAVRPDAHRVAHLMAALIVGVELCLAPARVTNCTGVPALPILSAWSRQGPMGV